MTEEALAAEDEVYRRIISRHYIHDGNLKRMRPSSAAFERRPDEDHASCYIGSLLVKHGLAPADILHMHEALGLVSGPLACLRKHGRDAAPDPGGTDPEHPHKCDPAHGKLLEPDGVSKGKLGRGWGLFAKDPCIKVVQEPRQIS